MSHASLLVALDNTPDDLAEAIAFQMAPFDESEGWFADGSRWDWYVVGGRSDGYLVQGNTIQRKAINLATMGARRRASPTRSVIASSRIAPAECCKAFRKTKWGWGCVPQQIRETKKVLGWVGSPIRKHREPTRDSC